MPRKLRELRRQLRKAGFVIDRTKGSHQTWIVPDFPYIKLTLSGADGNDARDYQERDVEEAIQQYDATLKAERENS